MRHLLLGILGAIALTNSINSEPASRYKVTCDDYPCTGNERTALLLVNKNYGKQS